MGTAKRERQRANRELKRAELDQQLRKSRRKRSTFKWGVILAAAAGALLILVYTTGKKSSKSATSTTVASTGTTVGAADAPTTTEPPTTVPPPFTYGTADCPKADGSSPTTKTFSAPPKLCIDPTKTYTATFDTSEGTIKVALDAAKTPGTVNNFVVLSRWHYYDGTTLFRTDPSIDIIQGGGSSPSDPSPYTIPDEGINFQYSEGDLVMARTSEPNSGGFQFFFSTGPNTARLNGQGTYVTFGKTSEGLDVLKKIIGLHQDDPSSGLGGHPSRTVTIKTVTITES